jgi:hypothetical protein
MGVAPPTLAERPVVAQFEFEKEAALCVREIPHPAGENA